MMNRYNIFLFSIIFVVAIVFYYLFYYEKPDDIDETESRLKFLQESKNIEKKDFVFILESLLPKKEDTKEIIQSPPPVEQNTNIESIEEPQDEPPLKLLAILNDEAYISNKWYKINDTLMYKNHKYAIKRINGYKVFLVGVTNTKDNITLEMFPNNDGLYFESSENK